MLKFPREGEWAQLPEAAHTAPPRMPPSLPAQPSHVALRPPRLWYEPLGWHLCPMPQLTWGQ